MGTNNKLRWDELVGEIREEWKELWHNAHLGWADFPEMSDEEATDLDEWIGFMAPYWLKEIGDQLKELCGVEWTLFLYGRGGATVAPDELPSYGHGGYGKQLCEDALYGDEGRGRDLDGYNDDYRTLRGLRELNRLVRVFVQALPSMWEREGKERE